MRMRNGGGDKAEATEDPQSGEKRPYNKGKVHRDEVIA